MSLSASTHMNIVDLAKTIGHDGSVIEVMQVLNMLNDGIMSSLNFIEGNSEHGHMHGFQTSLPGTSLGAINKGVVASKGLTSQVTETTAKLESLSEVAENMLKKSPNPALTRMQYDKPHLEAMQQDFLYYWWYGRKDIDPLAFDGMVPRYSDPTAANGKNIINGAEGLDIAGKTDLESIWILNTGPTTITGIIPKRTTPGLITEDWGKYLLEDDGSNTNARIHVYGTYFCMYMGCAVMDWRYGVRIPNLSPSLITPDASSGPNLPALIKIGIERLQDTGGAKIYMSRTMRQLLGQQLANGVDSSTLQMTDLGGVSPRKILAFDDIPLYRTDSLRYSTVKPTLAQANPTTLYTGEPAVVFA